MFYSANEKHALNLNLIYPTLADMKSCVEEPAKICKLFHFAHVNQQVSIQFSNGKYYVAALGLHPEHAVTPPNFDRWHRIGEYHRFFTDCLPYFYRVVRDCIGFAEINATPSFSNAVSEVDYHNGLF